MPTAHWYGDYYGVLAFEVNKDLVPNTPADWSDLLKDEYTNAVALAGDPRTSNQAIQGVYAAGLSKGAAAGEAAGTAGLEFFKELNAKGNFVPVIGKAATLAQGQTPILITWDYNALAGRDTLNGNPPVDVVVPKTGVVAGVYVQAISAYAPHPNAAKLWMEYLYSDEGQLGWLKGYCHPIRFNDLAKNGKIPQELLDKLPPAAVLRGGRVPEPRRAGRRQDRHHRRTGMRWSAPTSSSPEKLPGGHRPPGLVQAEVRRMTDITSVEPAIVRRGPTQLAAPPDARARMRLPTQWLGVAPFFIFAVMFLILPTAYLMLGAFQNEAGEFTLDNIVGARRSRRSSPPTGFPSRSASPPPSSAPSSASPSPSPSCAAACRTGSARRRSPSPASPRISPACRSPSPSSRRSGGSASSPCCSTRSSASTSTPGASTSCRSGA